jgi:hypothetical protein
MTVRLDAPAVVMVHVATIHSTAFILPDADIQGIAAAAYVVGVIHGGDLLGEKGTQEVRRSLAIGPDLPGDAEERRIDDDADGKRDGRSYEQALVVVKVKLRGNMSFHGGLLCFVDYIGQKITITRKGNQH